MKKQMDIYKPVLIPMIVEGENWVKVIHKSPERIINLKTNEDTNLGNSEK